MENLEGTAAWFAKRFPGFLNTKCYKYLEKCHEELNKHIMEEFEEIKEEPKEEQEEEKERGNTETEEEIREEDTTTEEVQECSETPKRKRKRTTQLSKEDVLHSESEHPLH